MAHSRWSPLDTAAKIYPPSTSKKESMVFRLVCELNEPVDAVVLQHALDLSLESSPFYRCALRHGLFWYYLEETDLQPKVSEECKHPCAPIYDSNRTSLLFSLFYYRKRINLELYHVLGDAVGASNFFKTILCNYLNEKHSDTLTKDTHQNLRESPSNEEKYSDAFDKYYSAASSPKQEKEQRAFYIGGERFEDYRFGIIEGHISTKEIVKKAHELDVTVSELLVSLIVYAYHDSMTRLDEKTPVTIKIPINLRQYFYSKTERNFLGFFDASHNFSSEGKEFSDVLRSMKAKFKTHLTPQNMLSQLNRSTSLDHRTYIKIVPLPLKSVIIKNVIAYKNHQASAIFSNMGIISMPQELSEYIKLFSIFCSVDRLYIGLCSFLDVTSISFTSPFTNTNVQRSFFRALSNFGIDVEIVANTGKA